MWFSALKQILFQLFLQFIWECSSERIIKTPWSTSYCEHKKGAIGVGAQSTLGGHDIFARKIWTKFSEFYMIFARKMPEFCIIIARKIFFSIFFLGGGGARVPCPPSPTPFMVHTPQCTSLIAGETARSYRLGVMATAVESTRSPEVNEVDQRFMTLRAHETLHVPRSWRVG